MNLPRMTPARLGIAIAALLLFTCNAFAQGCALCYTQAAASGQRMIQALRSGILILIFPPMAICIGLIVISYRKRNQCRDGAEWFENLEHKSDLGW